MKKCPLCLEQKSNFTKDHLPFKALYKGLDVKDNPAIIKICRDCNQTKSIWDQEILALYGHIFNIENAEKAQSSLRNKNQLNSALEIVIVSSRAGMKKEGQTPGMNFNGIPMNTISKWMWYCSRVIYYFFERTPFEGNRYFAIPQLTDHNIVAENFKLSENNFHRINRGCAITLFRKNEFDAPMILVHLEKDNRLYYFAAFLYENEEQWIYSRQNIPKLENKKPMRVKETRDITDLEIKNKGGFAYKGIKKIKKDK